MQILKLNFWLGKNFSCTFRENIHIQTKLNFRKMSSEYKIGGKKGEVGGKDAYQKLKKLVNDCVTFVQ